MRLQEKALSDEIKKITIVDLTNSRHEPYTPLPLGIVTLGCRISAKECRIGSVRYIDYRDGDTIPVGFLRKRSVAMALLQWKNDAMAQSDILKRMFARGNSIGINDNQGEDFLLGMRIYKTELNRNNFTVLIQVAQRLFDKGSLLKKYALAFAVQRLTDALKNNRLPSLSTVTIDLVVSQHPQMMATGREIQSVLPLKTVYCRP
ncbi:hypothetical protein ABK905_14605 [Acerihabitans sp. KWT182]|uniref:Uncharacterized protein n=1 Tax=Acerihabitans sp. KWT182 TaxID=3157919 RepID=A0AAU7Q6Q5_9GAMM